MIRRGIKKPSPGGTGLFIALRALDPILQHGILAKGLGSSVLHKIGLDTLPAGPPNTGTFIDRLGLSPYRLILLSMATGTAVKQIYWLVGLSQEEFPPSSAVGVAAFNTVMNSLNTLLFTCEAFSASLSSGAQFPQTPLLVGSALYAVGIGLETYAEVERKRFKDDPKNEGKVCSRGVWSVARHVNYFGYMLWRTGFALAAGGWAWSAINAAYWVAMFNLRAIPALDSYCSDHYGAQWEEYKRKTPYQLIPYVY